MLYEVITLISQRVQKFDEQLPDTLQLMSGALKAGYSFNQALTLHDQAMADDMIFFSYNFV